MLAECVSDDRPGAEDDVEHAGRQDVCRQFREPRCRIRCCLSGFEHHRVACSQRWEHLRDGLQNGIVPWGDTGDDADRLTAHDRRHAIEVITTSR
jgi:hypothetical protein